jgi:hypothetical protein
MRIVLSRGDASSGLILLRASADSNQPATLRVAIMGVPDLGLAT